MIRKLLILGVVIVGAATKSAEADILFTLNEVGADVVLTGSGTFDISGLSPSFITTVSGQLDPTEFLATGASAGAFAEVYLVGVVGPSDFGPGMAIKTATSGTGDAFAIDFTFGTGFGVPVGYAGGALFGTATFAGESLLSLGAATGTYVWKAGDGDTVTLIVGPAAAVPEPSTIVLFGMGSIALALAHRRQ